MKLMTKEIEKRLAKYPLYSQDGKGEDATIVCKFFSPIGSWTWYVLEGQKQNDGDYELYCLCVNGCCIEYGYQMLSEIEKIRLPFGLKVERDMYFSPCKVGDVIRS